MSAAPVQDSQVDSRNCRSCGSPSTSGHLVDHSTGGATQTSWREGEIRNGSFFERTVFDPRELVPVTAYRCSRCGSIDLYAETGAGGA